MCIYKSTIEENNYVVLRFITHAGVPRTDPIGYTKRATIVYDREAHKLWEKVVKTKGNIRKDYVDSMLRRCMAYW